jgi:arylsulfatase A-like enzyme
MHSYGLFAFGKWSPQYGYARGFSEYRCITGGDQTKYPWLDESIKIIKNNIEKPHMFAMHHPGGHPPFLPVITTPYFNHEYSLYHKNLTFVDQFFSNFVHHLKINNIYDDALIILMSDHGRSLSDLKSNEFHFLENRLRVPLIIKNPDWNTNLPKGYNLSSHVSAQTITHEIVSDFLGIPLSGNKDLEYRTIDGISWVSETVDYNRMNWSGDTREGFMGLVGYNDEFKYTIYFGVDFESFIIKESSDIARYQLNKSGIAEDNAHDLSRSETNRVEKSAFEYLNSGLAFAKRNQPENLDCRTSMIDIL